MKQKTKTTAAIALFATALAAPVFGGEQMVVTKQAPTFTPPPPVETFGQGLYFAIQGGINAYQSYEGTERGTVNGVSVALEMREKVGGFGGIKVGYGWGGQTIQPAVELDLFYNGADYAVDARVDGDRIGSVTGRFDTGAALVNGIIRFDFDRFKPYVGVGIGGWLGQVEDTRIAGTSGGGVRIASDDTKGDFALQAIAGFDYFVTPRFSLFTEYKFLNYFGVDLPTDDPVMQHLVGVGARWFF